MKKIYKDVYLDVDGTLTRETFFQDGMGEGLRNKAVEFVEFLVNNFQNVYWFSANKRFCLEEFKEIAGENLNNKVKYKEYRGSKYEIIDFSRPFYIFDDELKYDYFNSLGFLINSVPQCMKEPYKSKINSKIHTLYYIPSNASMDILKEVMEDVMIREKIKKNNN